MENIMNKMDINENIMNENMVVDVDETTSTTDIDVNNQELDNILNEPFHKEESLIYKPLTITNWFFTFMCMNIPIIGLLYLLILSFSKSQPLKRDFARAYLIYQIIFITISVVLVFIFCYLGLEVMDNALKFMQEL